MMSSIEPVARELLGEPNARLSSANELRFGNHGSLSVDLGKNVWNDHEQNEGGGVLDLIERYGGITGRADQIKWLEERGNIDAAPVKPVIVTTYDYRDASGSLVYQVVRLVPKTFRQRKPDGKGGWSWSIKGVAPVPYRLPELLAAPDAPVYIVEGEKDADRLASLGVVATCNSGGAGKWLAAHAKHLHGRRVVVLPDNDEAGADHARQVARTLEGIAADVRIVALPNLPTKGDVSDWLDAGGTVAELHSLTAETACAGWPTLEPFEDAAAMPDAFPFHALGPILGGAARAIAEDVQAPDSLAGGSVLAAASLAVQPLANAVMPHGQRAPLSLFVLTGAGSGDRKSAVDAVACSAVEELRKAQVRKYQEALEAYEAEMAAKKSKDEQPAAPTPQSITTGNATIEGICRLLKHQSSLGIFSAEGGEMLGGHSLRDDKRSSGLAFFLKGWSGESLDSLRGGEGLTVLFGRRMAMHVLVQPILLRDLLGDPLAQGQGLLARCLIAEPQSLAGHRPFRLVNPHENPAVIAYNQRIMELLGTRPPKWDKGDGYELKPRDLHMGDKAMAMWIAFYNQIEARQAAGDELEGARPFASKAAEHAARIAGVITMIENPDATQISADAMEGAIQVTAFYLSEHLRLTGAGREDRKNKALRSLQAWMQECGATVPKKDVLQKSPRALGRKAALLNPLLGELVRRGYIRDAGSEWEVRNVQD